MKSKNFINEVRKFQKIAGLLKEDVYPTIVKIEPGRDTGMAFGAVGAGYEVTLSDGNVVSSDDEELLDKYVELRTDGRKSIEQLNQMLVGKEW